MIYQIPAGTGFEMRRKIFPPLVFLPVLWYAGIRQKRQELTRWPNRKCYWTLIPSGAAVAGEKWAKDKVIEHYTPMIDELAVDEEMKQHLILKLLEELPHFPMEQA